jgi:hypothetical protein
MLISDGRCLRLLVASGQLPNKSGSQHYQALDIATMLGYQLQVMGA